MENFRITKNNIDEVKSKLEDFTKGKQYKNFIGAIKVNDDMVICDTRMINLAEIVSIKSIDMGNNRLAINLNNPNPIISNKRMIDIEDIIIFNNKDFYIVDAIFPVGQAFIYEGEM